MPLTFLHVDTYNASNNSNTYTYRLDTPVRGVKSIALKSIELPIGWYGMRAPYNTFTYSTINPSNNNRVYRTLSIPEGNYTLSQITGLLTNLLNNGANNNGMTYFITDPTNTTGNFVSVNVAVNVNTDGTIMIYPTRNDVAFLLGFTDPNASSTQTSGAKLAQTAAISDFDHYVSLYIENIPTNSLQKQLISYKIPIPEDNGSIFYIAENALFAQTINVTDSGYVLDFLKFRLIDRYGGTINNQGLDFSFTLAINTD